MARRQQPAAPPTGIPPAPGPAASAVVSDIDTLYQQPLATFTSARNDLAKALTRAGERTEAARVKALAKPVAVAWAVNQVYWHARSIWDRLLDAGAAVRSAQIAALERPDATPGQMQRARDAMRDATAAHRRAVADAAHQAVRLAGQSPTRPDSDQLARMFEALSLAASQPAEPGRWTEVVQPAGFEALFGVNPVARPATSGTSARQATGQPAPVTRLQPKDAARAERAEAEAAAAQRARIVAAVDTVARARTAAQAAADAERQATDALADAELRVTQARTFLRTAQSAARAAISVRDDAERALAKLRGDA